MSDKETPRKRYILCPGHVLSMNDGQYHYIGAGRLARLYGVSLSECIVYDMMDIGRSYPDGLPRLYPRTNGDYTLPEPGSSTPRK